MATLDTIYRNQLGRAPDAGGLAHYQAQLAAGRSIDDIRQEIANSPEAKSRGVGAYAPTNPYQSQIDELTGQLGTISGQIGGYTDTIDTLRGQISTMQTDFASQLQGIMAANTKALEGMSAQYQQQLTAQQEAQERARKERELAAQTAAANQARAGQQAQFQIGSSSMPGALLGGLAGFKRRGEIKAATSDALSIAGNGKKSPNKMLNV
tara:strand:- start:1985 stop:2611 length:627 start_codon:yes stop_codon:yes gene_type:complete